jgi:signal transduction histidine kinase
MAQHRAAAIRCGRAPPPRPRRWFARLERHRAALVLGFAISSGSSATCTTARRRASCSPRSPTTAPAAPIRRGPGLLGLRRRVEALDGALRVVSPAGGGTTLRAEIPCGAVAGP